MAALVLGLLARSASAGEAMTYSIGAGRAGVVTDVGFGGEVDGATAYLDVGVWESQHDGSISVMYAQLLVGGWFESGRLLLIPALGLGPGKRHAGREILQLDHVNWTTSANARVALLVRVLSTSLAQPEGKVVNVAIGIEGHAYATADREALAAITFNLRLWKSTKP